MNEELKQGNIFGFGAPNEAYAKFFIGNSFLKTLVADDDIDVSVGNVTFEPGCRNNWHVHFDYQILLVTGGEGWYQEAGKEARKLVPGDVVVTKSNVKHWHGATKNSWFEHIAITKGKSEFLEPVSDDEYNQLEG
ncbi:cupin domain-containing protein [Lactobacillus sp. S2-2]|uniref:cupin domain-containing protein n=1 Tax=Lactobacillus sp. S2-2 TaxID=2692917 RepID=UPI001F305396|nr:cupin domain-containing protein [Lactobacillus sp. S2-2]